MCCPIVTLFSIFNVLLLNYNMLSLLADYIKQCCYCKFHLTHDQLVDRTLRSGADPARKFRRAISVIFGSQFSLGSRVSFRIVKNHGEKVTFVGFRGAIAPISHPGSAPDCVRYLAQKGGAECIYSWVYWVLQRCPF